MKHKAAIQLQITMFSCLNSHRACVYQEKTQAGGGGGGGVWYGDGEIGTEPRGRREGWGGGPLALAPPLCPRAQGLDE